MSVISRVLSAPRSPVVNSGAYRMAEELLAQADIVLNGDRPWDMRIHNARAFEKIFAMGSLGLGESYMDGDWEVEQLDEFFYRVLDACLHEYIQEYVQPLRMILFALRVRLFNLQSYRRAWQVGRVHYDLGNSFFQDMLDPRMTYTCGYWMNAENLAQAQEAKLDLICRKLELRPGMRVLDIGCGWGSFMGYAAERYGVECVGVTISRRQTEWARQRYAGLPLTFRLQDYRSLDERFDRIVSIGMFEHVGRKNHQLFMQTAHRCLKDGGLFLLHTIGKNCCCNFPDAWLDKYIFPNGDLPSIGQLGDALDGLFVTEDLHNFGADYDKTLMAWYRNFELAWPRYADKLDLRFHRMWRYYLLSCAAAFRARKVQLWQWVLSKEGVPGGYARVT